jgi:hypothetical protein
MMQGKGGKLGGAHWSEIAGMTEQHEPSPLKMVREDDIAFSGLDLQVGEQFADAWYLDPRSVLDLFCGHLVTSSIDHR